MAKTGCQAKRCAGGEGAAHSGAAGNISLGPSVYNVTFGVDQTAPAAPSGLQAN